MTLTRTKVTTDDEQNIAIGCILDLMFLKSIRPLLSDITLIKSPYIRRVITWCFDYYKKFNDAPGETITGIFEHEKELIRDPAEVAGIELVLSHLNEKYIEDGASFKYHFEFEKAELYLKKRSLNKLTEKIDGAIATGNIREAEGEVVKFRRVEKSTGHGVDIFRDENIADEIINVMQEPLFHIDGDLGKAMGSVHRGDVISVGGSTKAGKSYIAQSLLFFPITYNLNIAIFTLEMSRALYGARMFQDFTGSKIASSNGKDSRIPYFDKEGNVCYKEIVQKNLSVENIKKMQEKLRMQYTSQVRIYDITTGAASKSDIEATLEQDAEFDNFYPDVILIDYLDIMEKERDEPRDVLEREAARWGWAKRLAQKRKMAIISPLQYGRNTSKDNSDHNNAAGSIHKIDAITHGISINQTEEEKQAQLVRLKFMGRYNNFQYGDVLCTQALEIGRGIVKHKFLKDVPNYQDIISGAGEW